MSKKISTLIIICAFALQTGMVSAQSTVTDTSGKDTESILSGIITSLESIIANLKRSFALADPTASTAAVSFASIPKGIGLHNNTPEMELSAVTSTNVGGRAQTNRSVTVYNDPSPSSITRGTQPLNAIGTVTAGPEYYFLPGCTEYAATAIAAIDSCTPTPFMYVNFDNGADGWVRQSYIMAAISGKFIVGSRLGVNANASIRASAGGTTIGSQSLGAVGAISGNPVKYGTAVWWPVNFDSGVDGWIQESSITNQGVPLSLPSLERYEITSPLPTGSALDLFGSKINISGGELSAISTSLQQQGAPAPTAAAPLQLFQTDDGFVFGFIERDATGKFIVAASHPRQDVTVSIVIQDPASIDDNGTFNAVMTVYAVTDLTKPLKELTLTSQFNDDGSITYLVTQPNADGLLEMVYSDTIPALTSEQIQEMVRKGTPPLPDREPEDPYEDTINFGFYVDPNANDINPTEPKANVDTGWGSIDVAPGCGSLSCTQDNFRLPEDKFDTDFSYEQESWFDVVIDAWGY